MSTNSPKPSGSVTITAGIRVAISPSFIPEHSDPEENRFVFAYRVRITNESDKRVQLLLRHWTIIDGDGQRAEVEGDGVIGQQPVLDPGQSHTYSSFCPLATQWGTMEGYYTFSNEAGETFRVDVGRFFLTMSEDAIRATEQA